MPTHVTCHSGQAPSLPAAALCLAPKMLRASSAKKGAIICERKIQECPEFPFMISSHHVTTKWIMISVYSYQSQRSRPSWSVSQVEANPVSSRSVCLPKLCASPARRSGQGYLQRHLG